MLELNKIHLGNSYELIKEIPDKSVDLVIIDPPYGINMDKGVLTRYGNSPDKTKIYDGNWDDTTPPKCFFDEILRIGITVLIFGGQLPKRYEGANDSGSLIVIQ